MTALFVLKGTPSPDVCGVLVRALMNYKEFRAIAVRLKFPPSLNRFVEPDVLVRVCLHPFASQIFEKAGSAMEDRDISSQRSRGSSTPSWTVFKPNLTDCEFISAAGLVEESGRPSSDASEASAWCRRCSREHNTKFVLMTGAGLRLPFPFAH